MIVPLLVALLATSEPVFVLPQPIADFGAPVARLTRTQAAALRDRPVAGMTRATGFAFVKDGKPDRVVTTCREFDAANRDGYGPRDNAVNKMSEFMTATCGVLDAVIAARPAGAAQTQPPIALDLLDRISMAALAAAPSEENVPDPATLARRDHRSIAQFAHDERCTVKSASTYEIRLRCGDYLMALTTVLQGDLTGTGRDDLLVLPYIGSMVASFSYAGPLLILTRVPPHPLYVPRAAPDAPR